MTLMEIVASAFVGVSNVSEYIMGSRANNSSLPEWRDAGAPDYFMPSIGYPGD